MREETSDLVAAAAAGDSAAWDALVNQYSGLLWSIARGFRLSSADAGDAVQTTWLRLVENLDRIEDPAKLPGWLATTVRRECIRLLKRGGRERLSADDDLPDLADPADPLDTHLLTEERDAALWVAFGRLPERCRVLLRALMVSPPSSYAEHRPNPWSLPRPAPPDRRGGRLAQRSGDARRWRRMNLIQDDPLFQRLRTVADQADPVPESVLEAGRAAFLLRRLDAELAELVMDSAFDAGTVLVQVTTTEGTRSLLVVVEGASGEVTIETSAGTSTASIDSEGRFTATGIPAGTVRLHLTADDGSAVTTSWVSL